MTTQTVSKYLTYVLTKSRFEQQNCEFNGHSEAIFFDIALEKMLKSKMVIFHTNF